MNNIIFCEKCEWSLTELEKEEGLTECIDCGRKTKNTLCIACDITKSNKEKSDYYRKHEEEK